MQITWWGTAGFQVRTGSRTFLIDPYLTRNPAARPRQTLRPEDVGEASAIFISHGHFDHIADVPAAAARTGARVYCDPVAARTLTAKGLDPGRLTVVTEDGQSFDFGDFQAQAHYSRHVKFDKRLLAVTLARIHVRFFKYLPLIKEYPCGQVLSWRFRIEDRIVHHFGSGGSTPEELERLAARPTDLLLVPLQGHTHICDIALNYVEKMKPRLVIPHHQDDFFPPISQMVDIDPFIRGVKTAGKETDVRVMEFNQTIDY